MQIEVIIGAASRLGHDVVDGLGCNRSPLPQAFLAQVAVTLQDPPPDLIPVGTVTTFVTTSASLMGSPSGQ
ncbi:hypothetical protein [Oceanisphaera sp. KMM 10153]|uniref:hypothetical protein n=1 Tax=Oceanisphaera submarina TaxID=3390193 RepID=UPI003974AF87